MPTVLVASSNRIVICAGRTAAMEALTSSEHPATSTQLTFDLSASAFGAAERRQN